MDEEPPKDVRIDQFTAAVTQIAMRFGDTVISTGTGFFWEEPEQLYLVTNWHNVAGRDTASGKCLDEKHAALPDRITFDMFVDKDINRRRQATVLLRDQDDAPVWLEHPIHRARVDVACVPLAMDSQHVFPLNKLPSEPIRTMIGGEVFILGFPMGIGPSRFPIWKRASIATEPDLDIDDLPLMFVDTASSRGMSGAPVVLRSNAGGAYFENGGFVASGRLFTRLLGVYSGRLAPRDPVEASLGRVWRAEAISQIIEGGLRYADDWGEPSGASM